jgi:uncharacterized protein YjbI with pentapeptide repeats
VLPPGSGKSPEREAPVTWPVCLVSECLGEQVTGHDRCIAHLTVPDLKAWLATGPSIIKACGARIPAPRLLLLKERFSQQNGRCVLPEVDFTRAVFDGPADFSGVIFDGPAIFDRTSFEDVAVFEGSNFTASSSFRRATFKSSARFSGATFAQHANFAESEMHANAGFNGAIWDGTATFTSTRWHAIADFKKTRFNGIAQFSSARFAAMARFSDARFARSASFRATRFAEARFDRVHFDDVAGFGATHFTERADFNAVRCAGDLRFGNATLASIDLMGAHVARDVSFQSCLIEGQFRASLAVRGEIDLRDIVFQDQPIVSATTPTLNCTRSAFRNGASFSIRWAVITLDDAAFGAASFISGSPRIADLDEEPVVDALRDPAGKVRRRSSPSIVSALRANLADLALDDVDLTSARLSGAQSLDRLRLEANVSLSSAPAGWFCGLAMPPVWRWSPRQVLWEEQSWRSLGAKGRGWASEPFVPQYRRTDERRRTTARRLAGTYRALRKAREDSKDAPGAADLYYGEMEMRRRGAHPLSVERFVLWLYWLFAGYGLRASRALSTFLVVLLLGVMALHQYGFANVADPFVNPTSSAAVPNANQPVNRLPKNLHELKDVYGAGDSWNYAIAAAIPGSRQPAARLTAAGRGVSVALQILGPLLLGLALFSVRGRLKRF